jgi:hypothetical protein
MFAPLLNQPKGPALLAKAGVSLEDALWFYDHRRRASLDQSMSEASARMQAIKSKVVAFLSQQTATAKAEVAFA